jgi:hypothetical protein
MGYRVIGPSFLFCRKSKWIIGPVSPSGGRSQAELDNCFRIAVSPTRGSEVGPNLLETIRSKGSDFEPICLCQCNSLTIHFGGKFRQGNHRGSQNCEYPQRLQEIWSLGLLTVGREIPFAWGSSHQQPLLIMVPLLQLIFVTSGHDRPIGSRSEMGHSRPKSTIQVTSAYPLRAEVQRTSLMVRFGPTGDIRNEKGRQLRRPPIFSLRSSSF